MKKFICILMLALLALSCSKHDEDEQLLNNKSPNSVLQQILDLGFSPESIVEYPNYYVVEGDIRFNKIAPDANATISRHQAYTKGVVVEKGKHISIWFENNFASIGTQMYLALGDVINAYNAVEFDLRLTQSQSRSTADIIISNSKLFYGALGMGSWPENGSPGKTISIDEVQVMSYGITSRSQLTYLIAHELGHNIGLRHTDWLTNGESGATTIDGTPESDNSSIMLAINNKNSWKGFSYYDKVALQKLYKPVYIAIDVQCDWQMGSINCENWFVFKGRSTRLEAVPNNGNYFVGWFDKYGSCIRENRTIDFEPTVSDYTIWAKFETGSSSEGSCDARIEYENIYNGTVHVYNGGNRSALCELTYYPIRGSSSGQTTEFIVGAGETYVFQQQTEFAFSSEVRVKDCL